MKRLKLTERLAAYNSYSRKQSPTLCRQKNLCEPIGRRRIGPKNFISRRFRAPVILFKRPKQPFYYINDPQMGWGARTAEWS